MNTQEQDVIDALTEHIQESYELAMNEADVPEEKREKIHDTVSDAIGNNYEILEAELEPLTT